MTKQEFDERIGRVSSAEEFERANAMYMADGYLLKDNFCVAWKNDDLKFIAGSLARTVKAKKENVKRLEGKLEKANKAIAKAIDDIAASISTCAGEYREGISLALEELAELAGPYAVIKSKIKYRIRLTDDEQRTLLDLIGVDND